MYEQIASTLLFLNRLCDARGRKRNKNPWVFFNE